MASSMQNSTCGEFIWFILHGALKASEFLRLDIVNVLTTAR